MPHRLAQLVASVAVVLCPPRTLAYVFFCAAGVCHLMAAQPCLMDDARVWVLFARTLAYQLARQWRSSCGQAEAATVGIGIDFVFWHATLFLSCADALFLWKCMDFIAYRLGTLVPSGL